MPTRVTVCDTTVHLAVIRPDGLSTRAQLEWSLGARRGHPDNPLDTNPPRGGAAGGKPNRLTHNVSVVGGHNELRFNR